MMKDALINRLYLGCQNLYVSLLTISLICPFYSSYSISLLPWIIDFIGKHYLYLIAVIGLVDKYSFCFVSYKF